MFTPKITTHTTWNGKTLSVKIAHAMDTQLGRIAGKTRKLALKRLTVVPPKTARQNPSKPGQSPHSIYNKKKGGHRMRRHLLYAKSREGEYVVGESKLGTKRRFFQSLPTPALHEHGGRKRVTFWPDASTFKNLKKRKITDARKRKLRAAIAREAASGKPPKYWTDTRSSKAKRAGVGRQLTKRQKESFWIKVQARTIIVDNKPKKDEQHKMVTYPRRPYMEPALRSVVPMIPGMLRNTIK